jgi:hypothetical protein
VLYTAGALRQSLKRIRLLLPEPDGHTGRT